MTTSNAKRAAAPRRRSRPTSAEPASHDSFSAQATRVLEHIELLETQYEAVIDSPGPDLKHGLRVCASALRAFLEEGEHVDASPAPLPALTA